MNSLTSAILSLEINILTVTKLTEFKLPFFLIHIQTAVGKDIQNIGFGSLGKTVGYKLKG